MQATHSVDVNTDVRTAYNQWTQFEEFPRFMAGVERVIQLDDTHLPHLTLAQRYLRQDDLPAAC